MPLTVHSVGRHLRVAIANLAMRFASFLTVVGENNARTAEPEAGSEAAVIEMVFTDVPWPRR